MFVSDFPPRIISRKSMKYQLILSGNHSSTVTVTKRSVKNTHLLDGGGGGFNKGKVDAKHAKLHDHSQKHEPCEVMTQFSECEISNQKKAKREMIRKK